MASSAVSFAQKDTLSHKPCPTLISYRPDPVRPPLKQYVMSPLELVSDWDRLASELRTLKNLGVDGVTTDVYWAKVEPEKGVFDWSYYLKYASYVRAAGLKWVPILSFHKIGGNVGDTTTIDLPSWVWKLWPDMRFVDRNGFVSDEYIQFWVTEAYDLYESVMRSFAEHFKDYASLIDKVYLSMGPSGELRYPSYAFAAGWKYPGIGLFQAYSPRAVASFRDFIRSRYENDLNSMNRSWGTALASFEEVSPPNDGETYLSSGYKSEYGRDFADWYQYSLENHAFECSKEPIRFFILSKR